MNVEDVLLNENSLNKIIYNGSEDDLGEYLQQSSEGSTSEYGGLVVPHIEDSGREFGVQRERPLSMARFAEKSGKDYELLAKEIKEMGGIFMEYVTGKDIKASWRYISDVITYNNSRDCNSIVEILREYGRTRRSGMFGFSVESNHIHVIHDCAYSGGHCRDVWREQVKLFGTVRPTRIENKPIYKFTQTDWYDVFIYFFLKKRGTREIWVRRKSWKAPTDGKFNNIDYI
uniref:Nonstructural protein NS1 n=1 Tax=Cecropis daurica ambidensovirus TaxID=2794443 RepID=A0A8E7G1Z1_9VIRU|nr:MAG: nonstructural protein NS1 [Cecropis daurica ambidensovirus]